MSPQVGEIIVTVCSFVFAWIAVNLQGDDTLTRTIRTLALVAAIIGVSALMIKANQ